MSTPTTSKPATPTQTLRVRTSVRAGGSLPNHGLRVRTSVRAGGVTLNHGLRVRTSVDEVE